MINNYKKFLIDSLLESVIVSTVDFLSILNTMPSGTSHISDKLYGIITNSRDVKTNYNLIGISDKNDEISFIPDSQYQRFKEKGENPWVKTKSKSKIGRMVRQVLIDNGFMVTDSQIEEFVNSFKAEWDKVNSTTRKIEVVNGDKILYWYDAKNYNGSGGTLGNSCMRFSEKNDFMKIYADNPDKISLVVLTEDSKLLARALLWKLDDSSKKIFLDRIYYKNDSDSTYVNDWVFENIAKGDENIFGSYRNQSGDKEMICKIKKTKFDFYPYADTFYFIYRKIENGKILEDGFMSNFNRAEDYTDFVVSGIQDTSGSENIFTHKYSEHLGIFIKNEEAVYVDSLDSYIYKKDTKESKFLSKWYLESEVTYSDVINDWIPNDRVINHPKYGIIPDSYLIEVVIDYTGKEKTPFGIYSDMIDNGKDCLEMEYMLKTSDDYFQSYNSPLYHVKKFHKKFKARDESDYLSPNFLCIKTYIVEDSTEFTTIARKLKIPYMSRYGQIKITKEAANFYNIPISDEEVFIYVVNYADRLGLDFYIDYLNTKDQVVTSDEHRQAYDDFMLALHEYKIKTNSEYRQGMKIHDFVSGKLKDKYQLLKNIVDESADSAISNLKDEGKLKKYIDESGGSDLDETRVLNMLKLVPITYIFYMFTDGWGTTYNELVRFINERHKSSISEHTIEVLSGLVVYEMRSLIRNIVNEKIKKFLEESQIDSIDSYDLYSYLTRFFDRDRVFDMYSDLDLK